MSKWQNFEKSVAKLFATVRTPFSGSNSGITSSDSLSDFAYLECKNHSDTAAVKLMKKTEELAARENKVPVVAYGDPNDEAKEIYLMFNVKNLHDVLKFLDVSKIDKRIQPGTTIHKLIETSCQETKSLFELREEIKIQIKRILREKIVSTDRLDMIENLGALSYMITTLIDYMKSEEDGGNDDKEGE